MKYVFNLNFDEITSALGNWYPVNNRVMSKKLKNHPAVVWCCDHCASAIIRVMHVPTSAVDYDPHVVIHGIDPAFDGMTAAEVRYTLLCTNTLDKVTKQHFITMLAQQCMRPLPIIGPGWVVEIFDDSAAFEFMLTFPEYKRIDQNVSRPDGRT